MKSDTTVRRAIAVRLQAVLDEEVKRYEACINNPFYYNSATKTQMRRFTQRTNKKVAALKTVIEMLDPKNRVTYTLKDYTSPSSFDNKKGPK